MSDGICFGILQMLLNSALRLRHIHEILCATWTPLMSRICLLNEASFESLYIGALCSLHKQRNLIVWFILLVYCDRFLRLDYSIFILLLHLRCVFNARSLTAFYPSLSLSLCPDPLRLRVKCCIHTFFASMSLSSRISSSDVRVQGGRGPKIYMLILALLMIPVSQFLFYRILGGDKYCV